MLDLVASGDPGWGSVVLGGPGLTFQPATFVPSSYGGIPLWIEVADVDVDGDLDVITAEDDGFDVDTVVWEGFGDGSLGDELWYSLSGAFPIRQTAGDYNADGVADVAVVWSGIRDLAVLGGQGNGVLWQNELEPTVNGVTAVLAVDVDLDGADDLVATNSGSDALTVFRSQPETLSAYNDELVVALSGFKEHHLAAKLGSAHAGKLYVVAGTASGTAPGVVVDGQLVPLQPDAYTQLTLTTPLLQGSPGILNPRRSGERDALARLRAALSGARPV